MSITLSEGLPSHSIVDLLSKTSLSLACGHCELYLVLQLHVNLLDDIVPTFNLDQLSELLCKFSFEHTFSHINQIFIAEFAEFLYQRLFATILNYPSPTIPPISLTSSHHQTHPPHLTCP